MDINHTECWYETRTSSLPRTATRFRPLELRLATKLENLVLLNIRFHFLESKLTENCFKKVVDLANSGPTLAAVYICEWLVSREIPAPCDELHSPGADVPDWCAASEESRQKTFGKASNSCGKPDNDESGEGEEEVMGV